MVTPYASGIWRVKPGRSEEFVAGWKEFAEWSAQNVRGTSWAKLLRDVSDENKFLSIGPWEDLSAMEEWRANEGWKQRVSALRELLEGFEASTLEPVVEIG